MKENNNEKDLKYFKVMVKQNTILVLLIIILFILVLIYLSNKNEDTNCTNELKLSFQEIENFNSRFYIYSGKQTGAKLKILCQDLISNINEFREYPFQIPIVLYRNEKGEIMYQSYYTVSNSNNEKYDDEFIQDYVENLKYLEENVLSNKHTYYISLNHSKRGILNLITIEY